MSASSRWSEGLASLAIPEEILAAAPESPWGFPVHVFAHAADDAVGSDTPSRRAALAALSGGGSVLDVGCGAGAASLPLAPPATRLVGVDESEGMLDAFAERAAAAGVDHAVVLGRWPDVAASVEPCDVVVCHHVVYNVADLVPFVSALTAHARRRVVVESTDEHPLSWTAPLWRALHGVDRPAAPTSRDAVAVLGEMGIEPTVERWEQPMRLWGATLDEQVAVVRKRLCLPPERDGEIADALRVNPVPDRRVLVTMSWQA